MLSIKVPVSSQKNLENPSTYLNKIKIKSIIQGNHIKGNHKPSRKKCKPLQWCSSLRTELVKSRHVAIIKRMTVRKKNTCVFSVMTANFRKGVEPSQSPGNYITLHPFFFLSRFVIYQGHVPFNSSDWQLIKYLSCLNVAPIKVISRGDLLCTTWVWDIIKLFINQSLLNFT